METGKRDWVAQVRAENEKSLQDPLLRQVIEKMLPASFPAPWLYVYELTQNALDAKATCVRWSTDADGSGATFEHNGTEDLDGRHVRALSRLGGTTKGLSAIGFMGVGFKSVFARFLRARVTGTGWAFKYEIPMAEGDLGLRLRQWRGALLPSWDDEPVGPSEGSTTLFRLENPVDSSRTVKEDLARLTNQEDLTPLAVLALRGLRELHADGSMWLLDLRDGVATVTNGTTWHEWKVFRQTYRPSDAAMRRFLEVRQQLTEELTDDGTRPERELIVLVPLDADRRPNPPRNGRIYSTLPTTETVPFGFHIQADWLVDVTRQGLRDIQGDAWQGDIIRLLPGLFLEVLRWLQCCDGDGRRSGYSFLCDPRDSGATQAAVFTAPAFQEELRGVLAAAGVLPAVSPAGEPGFCAPAETRRLPPRFRELFLTRPSWRPDLLFGQAVLDEVSLGQRGMAFVDWMGWGTLIEPEDYKDPARFGTWWSSLEPNDRLNPLLALWAGVSKAGTTWVDLPVVPTESGNWVSVRSVKWLEEEINSGAEEIDKLVRSVLEPFTPSKGERLPDNLRHAIRQTPSQSWSSDYRHQGRHWLTASCTTSTLQSMVAAALRHLALVPALDTDTWVAMLRWARRKTERAELVPMILSETGPSVPTSTQIADPFLMGGAVRRKVSAVPAVNPCYAKDEQDINGLRAFLEKIGCGGRLVLREQETYYSRYSKERLCAAIGAQNPPEEANNDGYTVHDWYWDIIVTSTPADALQPYLEAECTALRGKGRRWATSYHYSPHTTRGSAPCSWLLQLLKHPWILCKDGKRRMPEEVLLDEDPDYEDAPVAIIDKELATILKGEGVVFGRKIPRAPAIRRLTARGSNIDENQLAELIEEAVRESRSVQDGADHLKLALESVRIRGHSLPNLVRQTGSGGDTRGDLNGWVVTLTDLPERLMKALERVLSVIPTTTTGWHALGFLKKVWSDAPSSVDELRRHLAAAYRYVLEDSESDDALRRDWEMSARDARVYGMRAWHALGPSLVVDDVLTPVLKPLLPDTVVPVVVGHLGDSPERQQRVAAALGIRLLSEMVIVRPGQTKFPPSNWRKRLSALLGTLGAREAGSAIDVVQEVEALDVEILGQKRALSAFKKGNRLYLCGEPIDFAEDAAAEIVDAYQLGQQGRAIPYLTGALYSLTDHQHFVRKLRILADALGIVPVEVVEGETGQQDASASASSPEGSSSQKPSHVSDHAGAETGNSGLTEKAGVEHAGGGSHGSGGAGGAGDTPTATSHGGTGSPHHSSTNQDHQSGHAGGAAPDLFGIHVLHGGDGEGGGGGGGHKNDIAARTLVADYEKWRGWTPRIMPDLNPGFDVESADAGGTIRRIEIKSEKGSWDCDASVVLTHTQFEHALHEADEKIEYWLYVVDRMGESAPRILPIPWPKHRSTTSYGFYSRSWAKAVVNEATRKPDGSFEGAVDAKDAGSQPCPAEEEE